MILQFSSPVFFIGWEVFYWLIPYPVFLPSLLIIILGGFSPETWLFETHQLPYGARMFLVVFRFSSPVSLIGLGGFSPCPNFPLTILHSTELAFEERGNCNNMTLRAESFQSESHVTTIIQNFILVNLTSTTTLHWVWLSFGASGPLLDLRTRLLLTLHTQASMYKAGRIFRLGIYRLSTCQDMKLDHPWASPSGKEWPVGWTQPDLLLCVVVSLVILDDKSLTPACQARWHRSLGVTRDDQTWCMYTSGTVLERLKAR